MQSFFVPGKPVPLARARGAYGHRYYPPHVSAWLEKVAWTCKPDAKRLSGPVSASFTFFMLGRRGDLSNYVKAVEDALNGIVWDDDRQIEELHAQFHVPDETYGVGALIVVAELEEK
jgi:Holliday junction resolvase RusA-like endonuclease